MLIKYHFAKFIGKCSFFFAYILASISELRQHRFTKEKRLFDGTRIKRGRESCVFEQGFDNTVCR